MEKRKMIGERKRKGFKIILCNGGALRAISMVTFQAKLQSINAGFLNVLLHLKLQ